MAIITNSAAETKKFAANFAKNLKPGDIVSLIGELGTGKTTFVQGVAAGLGIKKRIISPSFVFIRQYAIRNKRFASFYHVDLYRLGEKSNYKNLGLEEIFTVDKNVVIIEWADRLGKFLPSRPLEVQFEYGKKENQRKISIRRRN